MVERIIYHYCSQQSFKSIIESKSLWLTNASTMNDTMEEIWYENRLVEELKKNIVAGKNEQLINAIYHSALNNLKDKFFCCFSESGDILSQWRAYADDGRGFAIGFSVERTKLLQKVPVCMIAQNSEHSIGLMPIIYDNMEQGKLISQQLTEIINDERKFAERAVMLSQFSTYFKNPAFAEEKEWRIIHTPLIIYGDNQHVDVVGTVSDSNFRVSKFGISPYYTWNFKELDPLPIGEIIFGPQNTTRPEDLRFFLSHNGYHNVTMKFSAASYRS